MSQLMLSSSASGSVLVSLLSADDIVPGSAPSYQLCKTIQAYHPLGKKLTDTPITLAQSQRRVVTCPVALEKELITAFEAEWRAVKADTHLFNLGRQARTYGISSIALVGKDIDPADEVEWDRLWDQAIAFNVLDPLNTAGSLVLSQDPNKPEFQKVQHIAVGGVPYARSRTVTLLNEEPLYIEYTTSAFGFVGRSVFQRPLYPLKSFLQTLLTDDLVTLKSGVLIAKMAQPGSIIDNIMAAVAGQKRSMIKEAQIASVLSISTDENIETLNMQNLDGAYKLARSNILENIAVACDMPAKLLNSETFAEGFGEGTEDAKHVAQFVNTIRVWMDPAYEFMDRIVQRRAWNPEFYKTLQKRFPDQFKGVKYEAAFNEWRNAFSATWPNLLEEPDSEKVKVDDVRLKAIIALVEVLAPTLDPENTGDLIAWAQDNFNELELLFPSPLNLDIDALKEHLGDQADQAKALAEAGAAGGEEGGPGSGAKPPPVPKPFAAADSDRAAHEARVQRALGGLTDSVSKLKVLKGGRDAAHAEMVGR